LGEQAASDGLMRADATEQRGLMGGRLGGRGCATIWARWQVLPLRRLKMALFSSFARFVARQRDIPVAPADRPRQASMVLQRLRERKPDASVSEQLNALARGQKWAAEDPFLWERRCTPDEGAGVTTPWVKIGRR
jgi:hypothetical protein